GQNIDLRPIDRLREGGRRRVGEREAGAIGGNPVVVWHTHARGRAIRGEKYVATEIDLPEVRQLTIRRLDDTDIGELELFGHVGDPALAEALPGERVDATSAKHGPHSEFEGAGVRGRHDRAEIVGGQPEQRLGLVDGKLKARLALLRPVRAAEERL